MLNLDKDNMCFFTIYIVNRSLGLKFLTNNTQKKKTKKVVILINNVSQSAWMQLFTYLTVSKYLHI